MKVQPLSPDQSRVWLSERFQPGTPANMLAIAVALDRDSDPVQVRAALRAALVRHESLRSHYLVSAGQPSRIAADSGELRVPILDLRHLPQDERDEAFGQVRVQQVRTAFDLSRELPVRALLVVLPVRVVLVLTVHRIAIDESALGVLIRELFTGHEPAAEAATTTDATDGVRQADLDYWRGVLRDLPPATLPVDRPRSLVPSHSGASVPLALPPDAPLDVDLLLAAFQALLIRLGAEADSAVTLTVGNAKTVETTADHVIIRIDLSDDPDRHALQARVRAAREAAASHGSVSFSRLAAEFASADPRQDPFAPVALVLRDQPLVPEPLSLIPGGPKGVVHELRLVLEPDTGGKLGGRLEYMTGLFDQVTAERIAARYCSLLAAWLAEPDRPLSGLPLLTEQERTLILDTWNATAAEYPQDQCLHDLIAEQARLAPEALAVICGDQVLTYAQLDKQANRLARTLLAAGGGPGGLVAICTQRSAGTIVAILAIMKAGAAYVPLDPAYPAERLMFMLADSAAAVVVTDATSKSRLAGCEVPLVLLDDEEGRDGGRGSDAPPEVMVSPGDPCYMIYTSGSTGQPKGALNCHRGVINTMTGLISRLRLDSDARLLQTSSLSFDMSAFDILVTLLAGACLVVPELADAKSPAQLIGLVHRHQVTVWSSTPPLFKAMLDEALSSAPGLPDHLGVFVVGGDRFPPAACAAIHDLLPHCRVFNVGGVTEVSFTTATYQVRPDDGQRSSVPWGMPLPNQRVYVLDRSGQLAPPGVPGELYIGGAGVGLGYWQRPELTARQFLADPFRDSPSARMYRTGDLVRHLPDGKIEFLGRLDHQVKVRGFRVELGEVEAALTEHPQVREAVAGVRTDEITQDQRLVAYLAFRDPGMATTVEELRAFLGARLPEHMVPSAFVELTRIPLMPSGKTDRGALDAVPIPAARPHLATQYVPPRDELERRIAEEWSQVLGVDRIGIDDEFVALGGHSMLATATMATLSRTLDVRLSARDLLQASTPARLAARVRELTPDRNW